VLSIDKIFRDKLIPWADNATSRMIVGKPHMRAAMVPDSVRLEKRPPQGKRAIVKKHRQYRNTRVLTASWPDCGLNELAVPKLACVLSGYVDFQMGNQAVLCGPGYFLCIPPNLPHPDGSISVTDTAKSTFCEILYFSMLPNAVSCWLSRYGEKSRSLQQFGNWLVTHQRVAGLFHILMEEAAFDDSNQKGLKGKLLQSFLCMFQREVGAGNFQEIPHHHERETFSQQLQPEKGFAPYLHQYIQSHLCARPSVDDAARDMYLSRAQFTRRVRAETGKSFVELLNEYRIETAKDLLQNSDWTVSAIASFVGYHTPHYFQNLFRQKVGMTPNEYRKKALKK
jgi:AraC-like DNA-binding protein